MCSLFLWDCTYSIDDLLGVCLVDHGKEEFVLLPMGISFLSILKSLFETVQ